MPLVSVATREEVEMKSDFQRLVRALVLSAPKKW
jgi:hypothetical protein